MKFTRDAKGRLGWFTIAFLLLGLITFIPMIGREIYQYIKYPIKFEWEDIKSYTAMIIIGSVLRFTVIYLIGLPFWLSI